MQCTKKQIEYISVLNVVSAIAVVILHSNGIFWTFSNERYWFRSNIIECVMYFAVPIFFMVIGVTLIDYRENYSTKEYFIRRINKTVIPFASWSLIGVFWRIHFYPDFRTNLSIKTVLEGIVNTKVISIYWFFTALFGIYLILPVLGAIEKGYRIKIYAYIVVIYLVLNTLFPLLANIVGFQLETVEFPIEGYVIYVLIGYLLHNCELKRKDRVIIYGMAVVGLLLHAIGTYNLSVEQGSIVQTYKGYLNLPCYMYSVGIFVFTKEVVSRVKLKSFFLFFSKMSNYTFGIYLIHWYILDLIKRYGNVNVKSLYYIFGAPIIVIPICIILVWLIRKIPLVRRIVP